MQVRDVNLYKCHIGAGLFVCAVKLQYLWTSLLRILTFCDHLS
jgi:hypothetical protein